MKTLNVILGLSFLFMTIQKVIILIWICLKRPGMYIYIYIYAYYIVPLEEEGERSEDNSRNSVPINGKGVMAASLVKSSLCNYRESRVTKLQEDYSYIWFQLLHNLLIHHLHLSLPSLALSLMKGNINLIMWGLPRVACYGLYRSFLFSDATVKLSTGIDIWLLLI